MGLQATDQKKLDVKTTPQVRFMSLRWKLILWFTLLFSAVFGLAFYWFYTFSTDLALARIKEDLQSTIQAAAAKVDGDTLVALNAEGEPNAAGYSDDPRYVEFMDWFDTVHHVEPRAWPYMFVVGSSSKEGIFLVDLAARYIPERSSLFKQSYVGDRDVPGLGGLEFSEEKGKLAIYADDWGRWVSAYAPIKDSAGKTVGAIGVDFQAEYVEQVRSKILDTIGVAFAVTYGAIFVLVMLVSGVLIRPIQNLTKKAARVGEGDYEQDFSNVSSGRTRDEIGMLADVFSAMVHKIYQREQSLRVEVAKLRIEIDDTKRMRQVNEIVDTDFFRDLQSKASDLRSRRTRQQSE